MNKLTTYDLVFHEPVLFLAKIYFPNSNEFDNINGIHLIEVVCDHPRGIDNDPDVLRPFFRVIDLDKDEGFRSTSWQELEENIQLIYRVPKKYLKSKEIKNKN